MTSNKLFYNSGIATLFLAAAVALTNLKVEVVAAPTPQECNAQFNAAEAEHRKAYGFELTGKPYRDYLRIMGARSSCMEKARNGESSLTLSPRAQ